MSKGGAEAVNELAQQEQEVVDLEKEAKRWWKEHLHLNPENKLWMDAHQSVVFARHFYGLRNRALEEAARHVYESWMGGTMDDVRRDMVELGKVLNARKEDAK